MITVVVDAVDTSDVGATVSALLAPFNEYAHVAPMTDEDGKIYHRNPQARWNQWVIGGQWPDRLRLRPGADPDDYLRDQRARINAREPIDLGGCDGGRVRALDLEGMRDAAAGRAADDWDEYARVVRDTPPHQPWTVFYDRVQQTAQAAPRSKLNLEREAVDRVLAHLHLADLADAEALRQSDPDRYRHFLNQQAQALQTVDENWRANTYTIEQAHADYAAQPRIAALHAYNDGFLLDNPEDTVGDLGPDGYLQLARDGAVPGRATLTHDGRWLEQNGMDWFGMSEQTPESVSTYLAGVNDYLDSLSGQMWLVVVDCHI